jgi:hypothetical protein
MNDTFNARDQRTIFMDDVRRAAPAAFADRPADNCSSRYGYLDTRQVLEYFTDAGFRISNVKGGIRGSSRDFGMHTVRLRPTFDCQMPGDLYPEIVLTNSHDGTSSGMLDLGLYRTSCSNGLVVASSAGLSFSIPHIGDIRQRVLDAASRALEYVPQLQEVVGRWGSREMRPGDVLDFNRRASMLVGPRELGLQMVRRDEDQADTLWNVFNRTQENLLKGGIAGRSMSGRKTRTRAVGSVKRCLALNKGLWNLAETFAN